MDETLVIAQVIACLQTLDEVKYVPTAMHRVAWGMTAPLRENGIFDMMGSR